MKQAIKYSAWRMNIAVTAVIGSRAGTRIYFIHLQAVRPILPTPAGALISVRNKIAPGQPTRTAEILRQITTSIRTIVWVHARRNGVTGGTKA
jgi:hypothetical protein